MSHLKYPEILLNSISNPALWVWWRPGTSDSSAKSLDRTGLHLSLSVPHSVSLFLSELHFTFTLQKPCCRNLLSTSTTSDERNMLFSAGIGALQCTQEAGGQDDRGRAHLRNWAKMFVLNIKDKKHLHYFFNEVLFTYVFVILDTKE